jgi:glycosyltransferase involved in cell wall biosynthesis
LDSIFEQPHLQENADVEVIVVNDCSTDNTLDTILDYASKNHRDITIISHSCNKRQGAARNTGLRVSTGEYVWFVDADDCIATNFLDYMDNPLFNDKPDIFQFHAMSLNSDGITYTEDFIQDKIGPITGMEFLEYESSINYENRIRASWSKWFKREFLIKNNLLFEEGIYWEDVVHTLKAFCLANVVVWRPVIGYIYIKTPNSDMRGTATGRKYADTIKFCVDSFAYLATCNISDDLKKHLLKYYEKVLRKYKFQISLLTYKEFKVSESILKQIPLRVIFTFTNSTEYNWLYSRYTRLYIWLKGKLWKQK